jgi:hypothetical protein
VERVSEQRGCGCAEELPVCAFQLQSVTAEASGMSVLRPSLSL